MMKQTASWRLWTILAIGLAVLLAGCGSDDDDTETGADETVAEETSTTEAEETTTTEAETEETTTTEAETEDTAAVADDAAGGLGVTLTDEFEILLAGDVAAGSVTFNVSNEGPDFPHALTIVRAASIDDLPINEANGAVDTEAMDPADVVGSTNVPLPSGTAEDLTIDLEAGDYVFFCPVQDETRSHVAAGQIISVSVGG
jgi:ABC-type Fe3+-hydroxamate transport system substrate-binding protein